MRGKIGRRQVLMGGAAAGSLLVLPGRAPAAIGAKPLKGVTLNVSCWSAPYPQFLAKYIPEFEEETGAKVIYTTPSFPVYNQRMDIALATRSDAYDVINVTFIYIGRWIGAGWVTPLDEFMSNPKLTPADWDAADFLPGTTGAFKDAKGQLGAVPWIADLMMSAASRYDLITQAGFTLPDKFADIPKMLQAVNGKDDVPGFIVENHYGWTFIGFLQGFGANVFRNAPHDLMPVLDTPEAIEAAGFFSDLLRKYGPKGALSYTYDEVVATLQNGQTNYTTENEAFVVAMASPKSKVQKTCAFSMFPAGPAGRFPQLATHGWGIPVGSRNKEAAWQFIVWAMSKPLLLRMFREQGWSSVTRRSIIEMPEFKQKLTYNGYDIAKIYLDTIELANKGYMAYRTVPPYPQVDREINIAIESIVSGEKSAKEAMAAAQSNSIAQLQRAGVKL
ncbi:MAG TPA: extracellular solute-binding protein [Bradyrhizobium sp.]|uniref:ABC transporter substrate-binding protein n=1 Tax=Bradyrhizobium sp. TaxID=376 RepID=UPI002BB9052B|nr:extracellular solute-binding protein [Bradyrhizobium sp.]HLZ02788.1 extracellular solute-binding protein [Bradyrhizobium sp.]